MHHPAWLVRGVHRATCMLYTESVNFLHNLSITLPIDCMLHLYRICPTLLSPFHPFTFTSQLPPRKILVAFICTSYTNQSCLPPPQTSAPYNSTYPTSMSFLQSSSQKMECTCVTGQGDTRKYHSVVQDIIRCAV